MKRGYHKNSRSNSYEKRKSHRDNRSSSRSRDKQNKKYTPHNSNANRESRQGNYRFANTLAKMESDIKNHFKFKLPNLNSKEEEDTIAALKNKLNEYIGPVEHISRSRQAMTLNLGFKYDIDALSFLETGGFTVKTSSIHKVHLDPKPTRVFQLVIQQRHKQGMIDEKKENRSIDKKGSKNNNKKQRSYSSSSSSNKKSYRSESRQKIKDMKLQIYGIPAQISLEKAVGILSNAPGGPYKFIKFGWKKQPNSVCEYLQVRIDSQKAEKLLQYSNKIQIDGRPLIIMEESQRPTKQLSNFQFQIQFPKAVHPSKVLKYLQSHTRIVQMVANQQQQQDGKCKSYTITLNDISVASQLKRLGELSCGIWVSQPKSTQLVYRPIHLLPTRQQL